MEGEGTLPSLRHDRSARLEFSRRPAQPQAAATAAVARAAPVAARGFFGARHGTAPLPSPPLLTVIGLGGVAYGAVSGARWLRTTPRFGLHAITVAGNAHVTRDEVIARAHVAMGENLFTLSLDEVRARVAECPWVSGVEVARQLPDGLTITVSERRPTALIMVDGGVYLADADGKPFKRAAIEAGEGAGLTIVSGLDRKLFGAEPDLAAAAVRRAVAISDMWRTGHGPASGRRGAPRSRRRDPVHARGRRGDRARPPVRRRPRG